MDNPYSAPQGQIYESVGSQAPLTWKQILFSFEGRIPRRTYWGFSILATVVFWVLLMAISMVVGEGTTLMGVIGLALYIPFLWSFFAIAAKRWHDRDKAGWWILIALIPIIGGIWAFVECGCLRGTEGSNQYGGDPT
jgi:uncharacterized membrane protein YhaH (DUF805 family)